MTLDYNSSLPCGKAFVKIGGETRVVSCFYLFALLDPYSTKIVSLVLLDGDFINYDFELYKEAKYANTSEYNHGAYEEGSVRHRRMYTYPNPLNSKIKALHLRMTLILKKSDVERLASVRHITCRIDRKDRYGNTFHYLLLDDTSSEPVNGVPPVLVGIFDACKVRRVKERVAFIPTIPQL